MAKKKHPLAEVFGFPVDNFTDRANRYRSNKLCPYNNKTANCTKNSVDDPLGVCSLFDNDGVTIICPIRFRQDWLIATDAQEFFFPESQNWTSITEVRLNDANGESAGNIDMVLVSYDDDGKLLDFGALEIQAVYISGNLTKPFKHYMEDPKHNANMDWSSRRFYPRADYLSSSRKRLIPQLLYKGAILNSWKKKTAVAMHSKLFDTLPELPEVSAAEADIAWMVYDLEHDPEQNFYNLKKSKTVYTSFRSALDKIAIPKSGQMDDFIELLQKKLDEKLDDELEGQRNISFEDFLGKVE